MHRVRPQNVYDKRDRKNRTGGIELKKEKREDAWMDREK